MMGKPKTEMKTAEKRKERLQKTKFKEQSCHLMKHVWEITDLRTDEVYQETLSGIVIITY